MYKLPVQTHARNEMLNITSRVQEVLRQYPLRDGICMVFITHTTAALTINENADPDVRADILMGLERLASHDDYRHDEGNSDAHLKASLLGFSLLIPIENGAMALGTWQGIYLAEFDGPRNRTVIVNFLGH